MKCIVTAGPTYEELDKVRRLTNFSTGTLGTELANHFVKIGHEVTLLRGSMSTCRIEPKVQQVENFSTTSSLRRKIMEMRSAEPVAFFHAAAVSDFTFGKILQRGPTHRLIRPLEGKIPTREGQLVVELKPTPKILPRLRGWFPKARIIGWKYEVDGNRARATEKAERQLREARSNACVINGPAYGKGFGLLTRDGPCHHFVDKEELFEALDHFLQWLD